jgi:hypothetical protein
MDLSHKTLYLLHDGDSYELVVDNRGQILEIWRYDGNETRRPEFTRLEWCDEILQDRILDKIAQHVQ